MLAYRNPARVPRPGLCFTLRTLYLALSGSQLDVLTAAQWGLVDEVSPHGKAQEASPRRHCG
jgi:enoyl-CoA hydratase/carnithine racemase